MMTSTVSQGLISSMKKGKQILQNVLKTKTQKVVKVGKPESVLQKCKAVQSPIHSRSQKIWRGILPQVYYNSLAAQLGRSAAWRAGRKSPLLAFFGLVVAQQFDQTEDETTARIQDFLRTACPEKQSLWDGVQQLSMTNFEFGSRIGQGCNAAVYEARWKNCDELSEECVEDATVLSNNLDEMTKQDESLPKQESESNTNNNFFQNLQTNNLADGHTNGCYAEETHDCHDNGCYAEETSGCYDDDDLSDKGSDTDSDITIISWDSDEDFWREEGAPSTFSVEIDNDNAVLDTLFTSMEESEESEDEFDIIEAPDQKVEKIPFLDGHQQSGNCNMPDSGTQDTGGFNLAVSGSQHSRNCNMPDSGTQKNEGCKMTGIGTQAQSVPSLLITSQTDTMMTLLDELQGDPDVCDEGSVEEYQSMNSSLMQDDGRTRPKLKFDLAVKMMFNYDIESNVTAITRSMEKEMVPSRVTTTQDHSDTRNNRNKGRNKSLPPHPNIVEMWGMFVDPVPSLPDGLLNYPAALPSRIHPDGMGRNMTMFIVMKRYDMTLTEYLTLVNLTFRERLYLLTQLLEAVDHMCKHGISHRDMKTDNILLDTSKDGAPQLVLSDFGCCLADPLNGLQLPYYMDEIDKGGNRALMAPEIVCAEPGPFVKLDYRKADLWSAGALAYEILGADNPFYTSRQSRLDSQTYFETELPPLPAEVPQSVRDGIHSLLSRDPKNRPSAREVLNKLYTYLWAPEDWRNPEVKVEVTRSEVTWWIVTMATDLLLKQKFSSSDSDEELMMNLFVKNFKFRDIVSALQEFNTFVV